MRSFRHRLISNFEYFNFGIYFCQSENEMENFMRVTWIENACRVKDFSGKHQGSELTKCTLSYVS